MNVGAHVVVMVMMPMLTAAIMAVDPMMTMVRPVAGDPDHFPFAFPITIAMAVIWPVADFDANPCRLNGGPESEARNSNRHEQ